MYRWNVTSLSTSRTLLTQVKTSNQPHSYTLTTDVCPTNCSHLATTQSFSVLYVWIRQGWTKTNAFHVCITSYKLVIQDHQSFRRKKWKYFILDEVSTSLAAFILLQVNLPFAVSLMFLLACTWLFVTIFRLFTM